MQESNEYFERIADEWRERASELAAWAMSTLVNRTDVWGRYLGEKYRRSNLQGNMNKAITAPFKQERGKVFLQESSLEKHFKARDGGGVLGLHTTASNGSSRWFAIDIDLHDEDDLSVTREGNFVAATRWHEKLQQLGFDPLLMDSNGNGGFHLLVVFERPMSAKLVRRFIDQVVGDYDRLGLDNAPDMFPGGSFGPNAHGGWLRLPGRHHTRHHYHRVYNDEPFAESKWLEGHEAIDRILGVAKAPSDLLKKHGVEPVRSTICLDFDGVIHSYQSGWMGEEIIPDPPIHRVDLAVKRLRKDFRVVVYSARCRFAEGRQAIADWLAKHNIEVDDVCETKPVAHVYVDDRAVRFSGDWDQTIEDIYGFRK